MPYKLTITLSERDLRLFRSQLLKARESVEIAEDDEILAAARELVSAMRVTDLPDFVAERLEKLENAIALLTDPDWALTPAERGPMLGALAYLCDPEDIIPDDIPGIGLLDDADRPRRRVLVTDQGARGEIDGLRRARYRRGGCCRGCRSRRRRRGDRWQGLGDHGGRPESPGLEEVRPHADRHDGGDAADADDPASGALHCVIVSRGTVSVKPREVV